MESDVLSFESAIGMERNWEPFVGPRALALFNGAQQSAATVPPSSSGDGMAAVPAEMTSLDGGFSAMEVSPKPPSRKNESERNESGRNEGGRIERGRNNSGSSELAGLSRGFEDVERYLEERADSPEWITREW
jgi:hypothetical protein